MMQVRHDASQAEKFLHGRGRPVPPLRLRKAAGTLRKHSNPAL